MHLAITPIAFPDESNIGFTLRVALRNGFTYIDRLFSKSILNKVIRGDPVTLTSHIHLKPRPLKSTQTYISTPLFERPIQIEPKICLRCVKEKGYIKAEVQSPFVHQCSTHHEPLIDKCYACNNQLTWDIALLKGRCTSKQCGIELAQPAHTNLPLLLETQVADCLLASHFLNNREETLIKQPRYASFSNYQEKLREGFRFLNNHTAARSWMHSCINQHSSLFPTNFAATNINILFKNLKAIWPVSCVLQKYEAIERTSASNEICPFYADTEIASQLLSVPKNKIQTLVESGLIKPKGSKKLNYKSIIDISPVIELFAPRFISPDMKPLSEQIESLLYDNVCLNDIFLAVSEDKLSVGFQANSNLISSLYCAPEDLKALIKERHHQVKLHTSKFGKADENRLLGYFSKVGIRRLKSSNQLGFNF
ncbi:MAG: hypothetical protein GY928_25595 [Colwellia sp.]|nr:hypothetical protein [Colwellia sp.]